MIRSKTIPNPIPSSEITPQTTYMKRRQFLQGGLALTGLALSRPIEAVAEPSLPVGAGQVFTPPPAKSQYTVNEEWTPYADASGYNNFYEFGTKKSDPAIHAQTLKIDPWSIEVSGECEKPQRVGVDTILQQQTLEERVYRLRCVEAWSMVLPWVGFSLGQWLKQFQPLSSAKYVAFETLHDPEQMPGQQRQTLHWPYQEALRIDEAMHPLTLMAVGLYGRTLPRQNGAPLRLVVPWKYGFKSIKSIVAVKFLRTMPPTTWNRMAPREYGFFANVNPDVSHPRWSQAKERRIGEWFKRDTLMFNGYPEVASLYSGMNLARHF